MSGKCQDVEAILNQMIQQLKLIIDLHQPVSDSHRDIIIHLADVQKQITKINNMHQDSDANFIRKIKNRNCDPVMNDRNMLLNITIRLHKKHETEH